jgi:hypothetical protein
MGTPNVERALEELRAEYALVAEEVRLARIRVGELESREQRVGQAIESLERLNEVPTVTESDEGRSLTPRKPIRTLTGKVVRVWGGDGVEVAMPEQDRDRAMDPKSPLAAYVARGGEGQRLRSTSMVADLVSELDEVITRDDLKVAFFERFPREDLERFWDRADNAFGNALARAVKEKSIVRAERSSGEEVFASHEVVRRLREKKAARSNSDVEAGDDDNAKGPTP